VFLAQPFGPPLIFPNVLALDENGLADSPCGPPPFPGIGLGAAPPDNLTGLDLCPVSSVFLRRESPHLHEQRDEGHLRTVITVGPG
jgi:hypothetical protein